jgi:hypothetical protein
MLYEHKGVQVKDSLMDIEVKNTPHQFHNIR